MVKKIILIFLIFISGSLFAQTITAKAAVDSTLYLVGDYIHYSLRIDYDKNIKIIQPSIQDSLKGVEILKIENPEYSINGDKKTAEFKYLLSCYDSTDVTIPPVNIYYRAGKDTLNNAGIDTSDATLKFVQSNPVNFSVRLVNVDLKKDIKDVKDPLKIPLDWKAILIWVLIGIILLMVLYYLYKKYFKKKDGKIEEKKIIKLPPHVIALNSLNELKEKKLWQGGKIKEYHSEITEIIRRYFEGRFSLLALELTTSETLLHLKTRKDAKDILETTFDFLSNADLVKFAKFSPIESVNEEMMKQAVEIVELTIEKPEEKIKEDIENV